MRVEVPNDQFAMQLDSMADIPRNFSPRFEADTLQSGELLVTTRRVTYYD